MSLSQRIGFSFLLGLVQACGGTSSDAGPAGGSGPGSAGAAGTEAQAGGGGKSASGGSDDAGGAPAIGPQISSDKLDVLFVIDNSTSMSGKQKILANSLPQFVARLTNPRCIDAEGQPTTPQPTSPSADCPSGSREFKPLTDIHFGAISTSIGSHGGDVCTNQNQLTQQDDQAQLLPSKRTASLTIQEGGFMAFDPTGNAGESDPAVLATNLGAMITAAGQLGCGYEAPLEAMYRFLVDPEPPLSVDIVQNQSQPTGVNAILLKQRSQFLRPDSSLAVVIFSDENDCSMIDTGLGWFIASTGSTSTTRMPRATSACESDPNDDCCRSCALAEATPPAGCGALTADSVCSLVTSGQTNYASYDALGDSANLRCFDQQRRFGFDLLHPIERYSDALSNPKVENRAGTLVDNPLFAARDGKGPRSASLISVSVIVGAPWQDLATPASLESVGLEYLDAAGLESNDRWPLLTADGKKNVKPSDPLMIESIDPRSGKNPLINAAIAPATSTTPKQNPINGHEMNNPDQADLQFACIFQLEKPIYCTPGEFQCDCSADKSGDLAPVIAQNSPLCQPPAGGPAADTQYFDKAYPGTRTLGFARAMGERAAPASVCPKQTNDVTNPNYGYVPALDGLLKRVAKTLK